MNIAPLRYSPIRIRRQLHRELPVLARRNGGNAGAHGGAVYIEFAGAAAAAQAARGD